MRKISAQVLFITFVFASTLFADSAVLPTEMEVQVEPNKTFRFSNIKVDHLRFSARLENHTGYVWREVNFIVLLKIKGKTTGTEIRLTKLKNLKTGIPTIIDTPFMRVQLQEGSVEGFSIHLHHSTAIKQISHLAYEGLIVTDEECLGDLSGVLNSQGVDQRKRIAELIAYGCAEVTEHPYLVTSNRVVKPGISRAVLINPEDLDYEFTAWIMSRRVLSKTLIVLLNFPK